MAVYFVRKVILDDFLFFFYFLFLHMGIFALENMCNSNESESLLLGIYIYFYTFYTTMNIFSLFIVENLYQFKANNVYIYI